MSWAEFAKRFHHGQEIGRDVTGEELRVFYDDGERVGCVRQNRRTTTSTLEILSDEDAACAREWCRRVAERGVTTPAPSRA
jgi:hypothetical protein